MVLKIQSFHYKKVYASVNYNVVSSVRNSKRIPFVTLEILTNEGITGISYVQSFSDNASNSIISLLESLEILLRDRDALAIETRWQEMWEHTKLIGHGGIVSFVVSMIDIALWDIKGKYFGVPTYRLLGGEKNSFEAYASDGLWLVDVNEALHQSEEFIKNGFQTLKMRMGRAEKKEDIKVLHALRAEWGDSIDIMADVNQGWTRHEAENMIKELNVYNLYWLEEPISTADLEGYAHLKQISPIRICFGENIYGIEKTVYCLANTLSSFYTPDLQRIGGVTGWLKLAPILELYYTPSTLHLFPEISVHLMSTFPQAEKLEWMSWSADLFKDPLECINGYVKIIDRPGFGLEFK